MTAIICTLIICAAAVACYWLYLNRHRFEDDDGGVDVKIAGHPYRAYEPDALSPLVDAQASEPEPEPEPKFRATSAKLPHKLKVIPKLAKEYLDAEKKLLKKAQDQDMRGMSMIGDMTRDEAAGCRSKAEKLIKEANDV